MIKKQITISEFKAGKVVSRNGRLLYIAQKPTSLKKHRQRTVLSEEVIQDTYDFYRTMDGIYIPYNVCSSKNSRQFTYVGKPGHKFPKLLHSEAYQDYAKKTKPYWIKAKDDFLTLTKAMPKPIIIWMYFIRADKGKFDYINMAQGPMDLIQEHGWVDDDSMDDLMVYPMGYCVDKLRPGVVLFFGK